MTIFITLEAKNAWRAQRGAKVDEVHDTILLLRLLDTVTVKTKARYFEYNFMLGQKLSLSAVDTMLKGRDFKQSGREDFFDKCEAAYLDFLNENEHLREKEPEAQFECGLDGAYWS